MARTPVNISYDGSFPGPVQGRPTVDPWYLRQAHKPDVGLGGFDLGPIQDWRLPWSYPAKNLPIKYKTVKREFPVIIPKGRLLSAVQVKGEYSAEDAEVGVDSNGKLVMGLSEAQGYDPDTTTYSTPAAIQTLDVDDYYMYGEGWRFIISLANCTRSTVEDTYSAYDIGRAIVDTAGDGAMLIAGSDGPSTASGYNEVGILASEAVYPRKPAKPIGYSRAEVFADLRGLYQYYTEDTSIELMPVGSIAVPYIKSDGATITDDLLIPGGDVYDALIDTYSFLPVLENDVDFAKDYANLYGDRNGNYALTPNTFTGSGTIAISAGVLSESGTTGVTSFTTEVKIGDTITANSTDYVVTSVVSDTVMTVVLASNGSAPTLAGDEAFTVSPAKGNSYKVGYTMYWDLYASKGLNWQVMAHNGSYAMGTDTKGVSTRIYKFMKAIETGTTLTAQELMTAAMAGNIGLVYLYVAPIFFD